MRTNFVTKKWWEKKRATEFFHEHTYSAGGKVWEKLSEKGGKKHFLYSHEYRDQKREEKKRETIFPETHE